METDWITIQPKKDYQSDVRRRCDCGGYIKRFEKQTDPEKIACYCTTCYLIHEFKTLQTA